MMARRPLHQVVTIRELVTPEGVPLPFEVARAGDRAASFLIDFLIQMVVLIAMWLLTIATFAAAAGSEWLLAFILLIWFAIRTFYFIFFELRWQGSTPGKRINRIRVMDAAGGPLRADAVIVRNLMRELEVWVPLAFLLFPGSFWPDAPFWAYPVFGLWLLVFACLPLFNRGRFRCGDLVAGTLVVTTPKAVLLSDLGAQELRRREKQPEEAYTFTDEQLDVYGIYELQVLEDLLRQPSSKHRREAVIEVTRRIRRKIGWGRGRLDYERFLRQFYAALRARLERKMLLGKRKEDKFSEE